MKAAVLYETGGPERFRYEAIADPLCPADGILLEVQAISIEGSDVLQRASGTLPARPCVIGKKAAGVIREVGAQVAGLSPGMRVSAFMWEGSHAELAPAQARYVWPVPDGLDIRTAACVPVPFATADDCLFEFGRLKAGESVLIQAAAGGVGLAAVQVAKRAGATVFGTASSDDKLDRLRGFGLDHGINYREHDFVAAVHAITGGRGVDLVVDTVGSTLQQSLAALAYRGRAVTAGYMDGGDRLVDAGVLLRGNLALSGAFLGPELDSERVRSMIIRYFDEVASGRLQMVIDRSYPLSEAAAAHAYIESRLAFGRVVLIP